MSIYYNSELHRWEGEGVPGLCDYSGCYEDIEYGPEFNTEDGFYCFEHQGIYHDSYTRDPKSDTVEWLEVILTSSRWKYFRKEYPDKVREYQDIVNDN